MKYKICFVSPNSALTETVRQICRDEHLSCQLAIVEGNMYDGVEKVKPFVEKGVDAIISRGGTAYVLEKEFPKIPVVAVAISMVDILAAMQHIPAGATAGLMEYKDIISQYQSIASVLKDKPIRHTYVLDLPDDKSYAAYVGRYIQKAKDDGVDFLIGDEMTVSYARSHQMQACFLRSGIEQIRSAIGEAEALCHYYRNEKANFQTFVDIINKTYTGFIIFDSQYNIMQWNKNFAAMLPAARSDAERRSAIRKCIPVQRLQEIAADDTNQQQEEILHIGEKLCTTRWIKIFSRNALTCVVCLIQSVQQLQHYERSIRRKIARGEYAARYTISDLVGDSPPMKRLKEKIVKYAASSANILITGESGTGKEIIAQAIHNLSACKDGPFVAINCGAFTESLLESELFGYNEGSFTGAKRGGKPGVFEVADGGTLFLDEIGDMPYVLQNRLLRVLQERSVVRVGSNTVIPVNVRIIAATNQNLETCVDEKTFRLDLYYRLNVLRLYVPPLAERGSDIQLLAKLFLDRYDALHHEQKYFSSDVYASLSALPWKGNVRELSNVVERLALLSDHDCISRDDLYDCLPVPSTGPEKTLQEVKLDMIESLIRRGKSMNEIAE